MFSHPSGRPVPEGNGIRRSWIGFWRPDERLARSMDGWRRAALAGVVRTVAFTPWVAKSFAMSSMGRMWPWAMKGKRRMWRA